MFFVKITKSHLTTIGDGAIITTSNLRVRIVTGVPAIPESGGWCDGALYTSANGLMRANESASAQVAIDGNFAPVIMAKRMQVRAKVVGSVRGIGKPGGTAGV